MLFEVSLSLSLSLHNNWKVAYANTADYLLLHLKRIEKNVFLGQTTTNHYELFVFWRQFFVLVIKILYAQKI